MSSVKIFCLAFGNISYMDKIFCENLKVIRKSCNLTQKQVADELCVVESCYANWEQGRTEPSIDALRKLCKIFNVTLDELLN